MRLLTYKLVAVIALILVSGCDGRGPAEPTLATQPTTSTQPPRPSRPTADFEVAGVVTDDRGTPSPGAMVTMAHYQGGEAAKFPAVKTDAAGNYRISFTASTLGNGFVARAQVVADGYEEYWRNIIQSAGHTSFVENFRLPRITRIVAGSSVVLSVPSDAGLCRSDSGEVCGYLRVTVPAEGNVSIEVVPTTANAPTQGVEVCCGENETYGSYGKPITLRVRAGVELSVGLGMRQGFTTTQTFLVKTSFEPL